MHKQDLWNSHADTYLAGPKRKSKFRNAHTIDNAVVTHNGGKSELQGSEKTLQTMLATFLLDFFCDSLPVNSRSLIKAELCTIMVKLNLIPSTFLSDDYSSIRNAFSGLLSNVIGTALSSGTTTTIYKPLIGGDNNFNRSRDRYQTDFEEYEQIGQGGFATVHKVKSRIDNCFYAIKKIKFKKHTPQYSMKILNELHVLAQLDHKHVVRYHCGWVDMETSPDKFPNSPTPGSPLRITEIIEDSWDSQDDDDESRQEVSKDKDKILSDSFSNDSESSSSSEDDEDVEEEEEEDDDDEDIGDKFEKIVVGMENKIENKTKQLGKFWARSNDSTSDGEKSMNETSGIDHSSSQGNTTIVDYVKTWDWKLIIYIQMELCSTTLSNYLSERNSMKTNSIDEHLNNHLEVQLLSAIEYIHSKHLIHRDIKPSNIFLKSSQGKVRLLLGDFGLACVDNLVDSTPETINENSAVEKRRRRSSLRTTHTVGVGTASYAAPEQLNRRDYGPMVDIYSAGVVIFELYNTFSTDMERINNIGKLRERSISEELAKNWPNAAKTILEMTDLDPSLRPSASTLLKKYKAQEKKTMEHLWELLGEKDRIIKQKDAEIELLRRELDSLKKIKKI